MAFSFGQRYKVALPTLFNTACKIVIVFVVNTVHLIELTVHICATIIIHMFTS